MLCHTTLSLSPSLLPGDVGMAVYAYLSRTRGQVETILVTIGLDLLIVM